jgi:hypothetical protein
MLEAQFWELIDISREAAGGDPDRQAEELLKMLDPRSRREIEAFARTYSILHVRAYRRDLWTAAALLTGGMGDDSFSGFRDWLISRGSEFYERALADPDSLAEVVDADLDGDDVDGESMHGVMYEAWERVAGRERLRLATTARDGPAGPHWTTPEEYQRFLPKIVAKVRHRYDWDDDPSG